LIGFDFAVGFVYISYQIISKLCIVFADNLLTLLNIL